SIPPNGADAGSVLRNSGRQARFTLLVFGICCPIRETSMDSALGPANEVSANVEDGHHPDLVWSWHGACATYKLSLSPISARLKLQKQSVDGALRKTLCSRGE